MTAQQKERMQELKVEIDELIAYVEELELRTAADGGETVVPL